jgi:hypothetical protein
MLHLKEIDQQTKVMTAVSSLKIPLNWGTGPGIYKKDDEEDDSGGFGKPGGFDNAIM